MESESEYWLAIDHRRSIRWRLTIARRYTHLMAWPGFAFCATFSTYLTRSYILWLSVCLSVCLSVLWCNRNVRTSEFTVQSSYYFSVKRNICTVLTANCPPFLFDASGLSSSVGEHLWDYTDHNNTTGLVSSACVFRCAWYAFKTCIHHLLVIVGLKTSTSRRIAIKIGIQI